ncbi:hypothetical protein ABOM_002187 [Aspergillus bombycis]|uniref:Uncharacterized protein n=1 Tax=Aspergillus bombycis TaxID=109264 RepID=A0A1F8A946_9EURO|nr:hypothetical protein ABOM_002187 [Aspergillus bombycis]OGM48217.1 hypothetical protein ABOM_002187 [Aspergillus bombycis]
MLGQNSDEKPPPHVQDAEIDEDVETLEGYIMIAVQMRAKILNLQEKAKVSLFATSRFIWEVERKFEKAIRLEIRATDVDVQMYLHHQLQTCPSLISTNDILKETIAKKIMQAVDGMFLLARPCVAFLTAETTPKAIKVAHQEWKTMIQAADNDKRSKVLDNVYEQAMLRVQGQAKDR